MKGRKPSDETRAKMSAAAMGNKKGVGGTRTPEQVKAFVERCGGPKTPEQRKKMSEARKGKPTPWLFTPESRAKSGASQRGKQKSPETRRKMSRHKKTPEHKEKLRQSSLTWWANKMAEKAFENRE
jgi:hypothetical protein